MVHLETNLNGIIIQSNYSDVYYRKTLENVVCKMAEIWSRPQYFLSVVYMFTVFLWKHKFKPWYNSWPRSKYVLKFQLYLCHGVMLHNFKVRCYNCYWNLKAFVRNITSFCPFFRILDRTCYHRTPYVNFVSSTRIFFRGLQTLQPNVLVVFCAVD